jgi:hypothetical protein
MADLCENWLWERGTDSTVADTPDAFGAPKKTAKVIELRGIRLTGGVSELPP